MISIIQHCVPQCKMHSVYKIHICILNYITTVNSVLLSRTTIFPFVFIFELTIILYALSLQSLYSKFSKIYDIDNYRLSLYLSTQSSSSSICKHTTDEFPLRMYNIYAWTDMESIQLTFSMLFSSFLFLSILCRQHIDWQLPVA